MSLTPTLYDCFWASGPDARVLRPVAPGAKGGTITTFPLCPGVILFPAFFTPAFFLTSSLDDEERDDRDFLRFIVATPKHAAMKAENSPELNAQLVNRHLIIRRGLGWERRARPDFGPLFNGVGDNIQVTAIKAANLGKHGTHLETDAFSGVLQPTWNKYHTELDNPEFWDIRVHKSALARCDDGVFNGPLVRDKGDAAIGQLFRELGEGPFTKPETFRIAPASHGFRIYPETQVAEHPILSHHPIAVYETGGQLPLLRRFLHVSDLHLNMRQDLLAQSPARVLEMHDVHGKPNRTDVSPPVGKLVHRYDRSIGDVLMQGSGNDQPECIIVGGDLVDHIRNATPEPGRGIPVSAKAVWDRVAIDDNYLSNYRRSPDMIAAFTLFRHVCQERQLPILGVTGNHDAYKDGYGVSPRVVNNVVFGRKLANDGIAADHNLTFYEAILAFGRTYHEYKNSFNFDAEWLVWYHTVFSPWSDCALELPKQRIVGLGWGQSENMLSIPNGQGIGHLPRANDAMHQVQYGLLSKRYDPTRPTLLTMHFTMASFLESIPEKGQAGALPSGRISLGGVVPYSDYDFGTFQDMRTEAYLFVGTRPHGFSTVLTGHSHRKAMYLLESASTNFTNVHMAGMDGGERRRRELPARMVRLLPVVLSDSAGPLPRSNVLNEFMSWGSDAPAGSLVELSEQGQLTRVKVMRSKLKTGKPRAAVAFDYVHHQYVNEVWDGGVTLQFEPFPSSWNRWASKPAHPVGFSLNLCDRWKAYGISIAAVRFVGRVPSDVAGPPPKIDRWIDVRVNTFGSTGRQQMIEIGDPRDYSQWRDRKPSGFISLAKSIVGMESADPSIRMRSVYEIPLDDWPAVQSWLSDDVATSNDRFLSVKFRVDDTTEGTGMIPRDERKALKQRYDWDSWWTFEVLLDDIYEGIGQRWWMVRAKGNSMTANETGIGRPVVEQPSFKHREKAFGGTYVYPIVREERRRE